MGPGYFFEFSKEEFTPLDLEGESSFILSALEQRKHSFTGTFFFKCESCLWCATYLDKPRLPEDNTCPICSNTTVSSFPIMSNEKFAFNYSPNVKQN